MTEKDLLIQELRQRNAELTHQVEYLAKKVQELLDELDDGR